MKRVSFFVLILATASVGGFYGWARVRSEYPAGLSSSTEADPPAETIIIEGSEKHLVTPELATASRAMVDRPAPKFARTGTDGKWHRLDELLQDGPVLLTFIKDGCPCSEAAQSFFNELHTAYPRVSMRGVIDVDSERASRWANRFSVSYPLLIDPERELVRGYGAENSAYVVLISPQGEIAKHWPGYSEPMLDELSSLMAEMTGAAKKALNLSDAPAELYTGCPYEL